MTQRTANAIAAYDVDLAYVHDVGFGAFARDSAPALLAILREAGIREGRVVDLGCGSGIWAEALVKAGFDVTGIDISPAMIDIARRRVPGAEFHVEPLLAFEFPACRAVTALGEVLNYLFDKRTGLPALRRLFRRLHAALEPGGVFIFDMAEPGRHSGARQRFFENEDWSVLVEYDEHPQTHKLTRRIVTFRKVGESYRRSVETHRLQLYRRGEVASALRQAGFRVRTVAEYGKFRFPRGWAGFVARRA
jgi:SAM-dependent methyltransferase